MLWPRCSWKHPLPLQFEFLRSSSSLKAFIKYSGVRHRAGTWLTYHSSYVHCLRLILGLFTRRRNWDLETSLVITSMWCAKSLQSCLTLCNPMDRSPPGSSVHGSLQARILEWTAKPSSRGPSQSRDWTSVSYVFCIGRSAT